VVRQERKKAREGLVLRRLRGSEITPAHWDAFYGFYCDTADKKYGQAYLTREFFDALGGAVGDAVMLMVAEEEEPGGGGEIVAGALNLVGSQARGAAEWHAGCAHAPDARACLAGAVWAQLGLPQRAPLPAHGAF
jgi:predicted N-acyltransferase